MFLATHGILSTLGEQYLPWSTDTYSFDYDGVSDYINVGNDPLFNFDKDDAFSLSCWFKCGSSSSVQTLMGKANSSNQGYYLALASNGKLVFALRDSNNNAFITFPSPSYNDNQWHHVLSEYSGSNSPSGMSMYIDGAQVSLSTSSSSNSLSGSIQVSSGLHVGARNGVDIINGLIDEPAIFSQNLGSVNASTMYGSGSASDITSYSPVGWWRAENSYFNGSNWNVSNAYKKGFNGTSVSMTSNSRATDIPT